eukprot:15058320-Alexandrium_andersonii.AAC.1
MCTGGRATSAACVYSSLKRLAAICCTTSAASGGLPPPPTTTPTSAAAAAAVWGVAPRETAAKRYKAPQSAATVSYTHLTLPTICSV